MGKSKKIQTISISFILDLPDSYRLWLLRWAIKLNFPLWKPILSGNYMFATDATVSHKISRIKWNN